MPADVRERHVHAMGGNVHLVALGGPDHALERALARLDAVERRWSRFLSQSELSRLNRSTGWVTLDDGTFHLVEAAIEAWWDTGGLFDPTVHDALVTAGYDRTFAEVPEQTTRRSPVGPTPGCATVEVDRDARRVRLPHGTTLDLGGIGKGWTADLLVDQLRGEGCAGVCANVGGDLRVSGTGPADGRWLVEIATPEPGVAGSGASEPSARPDHVLALLHGAVATSSTLGRSWGSGRDRAHHLIDPRTGTPAHTDLETVTVVADLASRAEVLAKVALLSGADGARALLDRQPGVAAELIDIDGTSHHVGGFDRYLSNVP